MPLVKCSDGFSMRTPCGMNVMCNSNQERQIKFKLHKKKCQVCKDSDVEESTIRTQYFRFGLVVKEEVRNK